MRPYFSIIIPYHNSAATIGALLNSIAKSKHAPPLEVIVVDDGSEHEFRIENLELRMKNSEFRMKKNRFTFHVSRFTLKKNQGPAVARNRGAKAAKGKFIVFLDSDVVLFPDALVNLWKIYKEDPDIVAVTGVWVKEQKTQAFFPNFKALRDWSYWINERDINGYYYLFSTRIASIKRSVFQRLKGFDEVYAGPLVEDIEFTYRIARRYAVIFAPNVRVHHEFEGFWPIAKKYFWRTYYWTKLFQNRKKFDPVATTGKEAATALSGAAVITMFIITLLFQISNFQTVSRLTSHVSRLVFLVPLITLLFHLFLVRKFLWFVYREKGLLFSVKSFFAGLVLYCFIVAGAGWGRISKNVV